MIKKLVHSKCSLSPLQTIDVEAVQSDFFGKRPLPFTVMFS